MTDATRYPLAWPLGWPRKPAGQRARAKFTKVERKYSSTPGSSHSWVDRRSLTVPLHPDMPGGSHEAMAQLNEARDAALQEIGQQ